MTMRCWPTAESSAFMKTLPTRPLPSVNGWTSTIRNMTKIALNPE